MYISITDDIHDNVTFINLPICNLDKRIIANIFTVEVIMISKHHRCSSLNEKGHYKEKENIHTTLSHVT